MSVTIPNRRNGNGGRRDMDRLRADMHRTIRLVMVVLTLAGIAVLASIATYVNSRDDDKRAQEARAFLIDITKDIKSCTTPEGECSKRGANNGVVLATAITYCTITLPNDATKNEVNLCIVHELKEQGR